MAWSLNEVDRQSTPVYRSLRCDLFDGLSGIVVFFAHVLPFCDERPLRRTLEASALLILDQIEADHDSGTCGLLGGRTGAILAILKAADALQNESLKERAAAVAATIPNRFDVAAQLDFLHGSAGCLGTLAEIAAYLGDENLMASTVRQGEALIHAGSHNEDGLLWNLPEPTTNWPPVTTWTRLAAIVCSVVELATASQHAPLQKAAVDAVRGLCAVLPRPTSSTETGESAVNQLCWRCGVAGAGIPLTRIVFRCGDVPFAADALQSLADHSVNITQNLQTEPIRDASLFGGLAGIVDFLMSASCVLHRPELHASAVSIGRLGMDQIVDGDRVWPCGTLNGQESPTLMPGLAGIGLTCLRLHGSQSPENSPFHLPLDAPEKD